MNLLLVATTLVYIGRENQVNVRIPRIETDVTVDGNLNEPVWQQAAVLTGFSEFSPHDGIPAADSTQVLVWYSPSAVYFGIRAFELHGAPHATLADRDKISADDNVQILLGTFLDHRQAYVFAVNPLGVQMDGTIVEQGQTLAHALGPRRTRSQSGFRLQLEGPSHQLRLRGRDPNSAQESQVPIRR